jgi:hypothetical protein
VEELIESLTTLCEMRQVRPRGELSTTGSSTGCHHDLVEHEDQHACGHNSAMACGRFVG